MCLLAYTSLHLSVYLALTFISLATDSPINTWVCNAASRVITYGSTYFTHTYKTDWQNSPRFCIPESNVTQYATPHYADTQNTDSHAQTPRQTPDRHLKAPPQSTYPHDAPKHPPCLFPWIYPIQLITIPLPTSVHYRLYSIPISL